jgi:hypothetical protein
MCTRSEKFRRRIFSLGVVIFGCLLSVTALAQDDTDGDPYPQPTSTSKAPGGKVIDLVSVQSGTCSFNLYEKVSSTCKTISNVQSTSSSFYSGVVAGSSTALPQLIDLNLPQGPSQGFTIAVGLDTTATITGIQTIFTLKYGNDSNGQDIAVAVLRDESGAWYFGKRVDGPTTTLRYLTRLWDPQSPCTSIPGVCSTDTIYISFFSNGQIQFDEFSQLTSGPGVSDNWQSGLLNYGYPISSYASGTLVSAPTTVPAYLPTRGLSIGTLPGNEFGITSYNASSANYAGAKITRVAVWDNGTIGGGIEALLQQAMIQDQSAALTGVNNAWLPCNSGQFQRLIVNAPSSYSPSSLFTPCTPSGINYSPQNVNSATVNGGITLWWSSPLSPAPNPSGYTATLYDTSGNPTSISTNLTSAVFNGLPAGAIYTAVVASNYSNLVPNNLVYASAQQMTPTGLYLTPTSFGQLLNWAPPSLWTTKNVSYYYIGTPTSASRVQVSDIPDFLSYMDFTTLGNNVVSVTPVFSDSTSGGTAQITMNVQGTLDLSAYMNVYGDYDYQQTFTTGGMDGKGHAYLWNELSYFLTNSIPFYLVTPNGPSAVRGKTVPLPFIACSSITLLATGVNGNQSNQNFTVTYSDGSTTKIRQSMSDWGTPQHYANETIAAHMNYRAVSNGTQQSGNWYVYSYMFNLDNTKTLKSINLGTNTNLVIVAMTLQ